MTTDIISPKLRRAIQKRLKEINLPVTDKTTGPIIELAFCGSLLVWNEKDQILVVAPFANIGACYE